MLRTTVLKIFFCFSDLSHSAATSRRGYPFHRNNVEGLKEFVRVSIRLLTKEARIRAKNG